MEKKEKKEGNWWTTLIYIINFLPTPILFYFFICKYLYGFVCIEIDSCKTRLYMIYIIWLPTMAANWTDIFSPAKSDKYIFTCLHRDKK